MPYTITFQPLYLTAGVTPKSVTKNTAAEAWTLVQQLHASDEKTEIKDSLGHPIEWQELRILAEKEAN
ncbi:hypothetical protein [Nitrospirillum iridis]|uniref:Uncharacterized protein n=1 Tax=Nitrospirillum iridis TaxID=765888 RepID=A0A7X0AU66_9PROT|nr:hypothetical protein [Nitrospirillum iridis]MBB6250113.1 hypothetical protein [Nitrospirillum iridis]